MVTPSPPGLVGRAGRKPVPPGPGARSNALTVQLGSSEGGSHGPMNVGRPIGVTLLSDRPSLRRSSLGRLRHAPGPFHPGPVSFQGRLSRRLRSRVHHLRASSNRVCPAAEGKHGGRIGWHRSQGFGPRRARNGPSRYESTSPGDRENGDLFRRPRAQEPRVRSDDQRTKVD
jgi:hypothetical protein